MSMRSRVERRQLLESLERPFRAAEVAPIAALEQRGLLAGRADEAPGVVVSGALLRHAHLREVLHAPHPLAEKPTAPRRAGREISSRRLTRQNVTVDSWVRLVETRARTLAIPDPPEVLRIPRPPPPFVQREMWRRVTPTLRCCTGNYSRNEWRPRHGGATCRALRWCPARPSPSQGAELDFEKAPLGPGDWNRVGPARAIVRSRVTCQAHFETGQ
jgi:hypothetical protein